MTERQCTHLLHCDGGGAPFRRCGCAAYEWPISNLHMYTAVLMRLCSSCLFTVWSLLSVHITLLPPVSEVPLKWTVSSEDRAAVEHGCHRRVLPQWRSGQQVRCQKFHCVQADNILLPVWKHRLTLSPKRPCSTSRFYLFSSPEHNAITTLTESVNIMECCVRSYYVFYYNPNSMCLSRKIHFWSCLVLCWINCDELNVIPAKLSTWPLRRFLGSALLLPLPWEVGHRQTAPSLHTMQSILCSPQGHRSTRAPHVLLCAQGASSEQGKNK